jgi:phosphatidate cytidylyltransferase
MILALIPIFYSKLVWDNHLPLITLALILTIVATTEIISMKETERKLPFFIRLTMYLSILYLAFQEVMASEWGVQTQLDILPLVIIIIALMLVVSSQFKINDAGLVLFSIFYLGLGFAGLTHFFIVDMKELFYIIFIAIATDTFAYFTGVFFGKHKLIPRISPKKTIEGSVGGTVIATVLVSLFAYFVMDKTDLLLVIPITLGLSIISQFGDLVASVLKRQFKIKDYGNLFPGHGGVLDRLDSMLFTIITYSYLLIILKDLFQLKF